MVTEGCKSTHQRQLRNLLALTLQGNISKLCRPSFNLFAYNHWLRALLRVTGVIPRYEAM